jgi:hypothetical protein
MLLKLDLWLQALLKVVIIFGNAAEAHVFIAWSQKKTEDAEELFWPNESEDPDLIIRLHEQDMTVIFSCEPLEDDSLTTRVEERHPLAGYGTTYLRRILNVDATTSDDDPIYFEAVSLVTGFAIHASRRMDRELNYKELPRPNMTPRQSLPGQPLILEVFRITNSAKLIFSGLPFDSGKVSSYAEFFSKAALQDSTLPSTFTPFLKKVRQGTSTISPAQRLIRQVLHLAKIVLLFVHVVELESCADIPLILLDDLNHVQLSGFLRQISKEPSGRGSLELHEVFHGVTQLLSSTVLNSRDDMHKFSSRLSHFLFLCSDFGWSVYLDTVGDKDPGQVRPELVHVCKGTPTKKVTNERKMRIRDGAGFEKKDYPDIYIVERGPAYVPRTIATLARRKEYWSTQLQKFEHSIHITVKPSAEWQDRGAVEEIDGLAAYRIMQDSLWTTYVTPECEHMLNSDENWKEPKEIKLGPDAAALLGWSNAIELIRGPCPERILIYLTRGDRHVRWLAILSDPRAIDQQRQQASDAANRLLL